MKDIVELKQLAKSGVLINPEDALELLRRLSVAEFDIETYKGTVDKLREENARLSRELCRAKETPNY